MVWERPLSFALSGLLVCGLAENQASHYLLGGWSCYDKRNSVEKVKEKRLSYFEHFLAANQAYVELHGTALLPAKPKMRVAIVTCMDSRLHVAQALGLALGDAHILRNAGGRVTDDMIRSLVISQQQMGTREIVVLHHTDCGAQTFTNASFTEQIQHQLGLDVSGCDFLPFTDVIQSVKDDMAILKASPLIPADVVINGAVYDVTTGQMTAVD